MLLKSLNYLITVSKYHNISPSPEVGRDGEAQRSPGGERQSRTGSGRLRYSPPGRFATTLPMKGRENAPTSLPTSGEGEDKTLPPR